MWTWEGAGKPTYFAHEEKHLSANTVVPDQRSAVHSCGHWLTVPIQVPLHRDLEDAGPQSEHRGREELQGPRCLWQTAGPWLPRVPTPPSFLQPPCSLLTQLAF